MSLSPLEMDSGNNTTVDETFNENEYCKVKEDTMRTLLNGTQKIRRNYLFWFINLGFISFISMFLWRYNIFISQYFLSEPIPLDKVEKELYANVVKQHTAIAIIVSNLHDLNHLPPKKILTCIVGPTGVGKSNLANILAKQLSSNNIDIFHRHDMPDLCNKQSFLSKQLRMKVYFSEYFVIILDDLIYDDLDALKIFTKMTFEIEYTSILILTMFNVQTKNCLDYTSEKIKNPSLIRKEMALLSKNFHFVHFQSLDELTVRLWLKRTIMQHNVESEFHDEIIDSILEFHDIGCQGLKGLNSKLLVELSQRKL